MSTVYVSGLFFLLLSFFQFSSPSFIYSLYVRNIFLLLSFIEQLSSSSIYSLRVGTIFFPLTCILHLGLECSSDHRITIDICKSLSSGGGCTLPSGQHYGLWIFFSNKWVMRLCCWVFQMSFEQDRVWEHKADNWHQTNLSGTTEQWFLYVCVF